MRSLAGVDMVLDQISEPETRLLHTFLPRLIRQHTIA